MPWFRQHRRSLLRLTLGVWLLAVLVMAFQACLVQADHPLTAAHEAYAAVQQDEGHALHASGCVQHCDDAARALSPTAQNLAKSLATDVPSLAIFLLPVLMLFGFGGKITFAALRLRRLAPPGPPARLIFVRFND
jgi:hypothetical protein